MQRQRTGLIALCWGLWLYSWAGSTPPRLVFEKKVSEEANFVLYRPVGWSVVERVHGEMRTVEVRDPSGWYAASLSYGTAPVGSDVVAAAKDVVSRLGRGVTDLKISNSLVSRDKRRIVFDAAYTDAGKRNIESRLWVVQQGQELAVSRLDVPQGRFNRTRQLLLTVLSNIRVIRGAYELAAQPVLPLGPYRLRDGSASFQKPPDWQVVEFGKGAFAAGDPKGGGSFIVASVEVLTPQLGVRVPGKLLSPYLRPHRALEFTAVSQRLISTMKATEIRPREDIAQLVRKVYTAGRVTVEEFVYTFTAKGRRSKGYTFGISFGSRLNVNWRFWHITVGAPLEQFDSLIPTFVTMVKSYTIDDRFARDYIARGTARLREMQAETRRLVRRNAEDIPRMMQAAYDERQRSMDYIDYQRSTYIRGHQDWISAVEGGTVYHTDSWGTRNTVTGEHWEGKHYNYVHFKGENPKYAEQMTPVDSRALYERHVRGR